MLGKGKSWSGVLAAALFLTIASSGDIKAADALTPVPSKVEMSPKPDVNVWLRLIRNDKLDLVLPELMRKHGIEMFIHAARAGNPDPLAYEFGITDGYLIFTDTGDKIERAAFTGLFGGSGAVENIDVRASTVLARAITGYDHGTLDFSAVYDEVREYVAGHDPAKIAVNFSDWLAVADGISHSQFVELESMLGRELASRIVSAEYLISDFRSRRLALEVAVQAMLLELARQNAMKKISSIVPGKTTIGDLGGSPRVYFSRESDRIREPMATSWISHPGYVLKGGDFFAFNSEAEYLDFGFSSFGVDTKVHVYIMPEGETKIPASIQAVWDYGKRAQGIIRDNVRVGMTAGEAHDAIVNALELDGYVYTPFPDDPVADYRMIQDTLTGQYLSSPGFYIDLHAMGNNGGDLTTLGASIAPFRRDRDPFVIENNHIFAFEYAVHLNIPERVGYPLTVNFSNPQVVTTNGVEWIQDPNYGIYVIH